MAFGRRRLALISLFFYLVALALYLVGFSMTYWVTDYSGKSYHLGLWQYCEVVLGLERTEECIYVVDAKEEHLKGNRAFLRAVQAFQVLSLMSALAGGVAICLWIKYSDQRKFPIISGVLVIAAALLSFLGLIIFGAEFSKWNNRPPNGWGFWVIMLASILFFLQGIVWGVLVLIPSLGFNYSGDHKYHEGATSAPRNYRPPSHPAGLY